jgi:DNA polymerase-3 subunit beta
LFETDDARIVSRLLEGKFYDVDRVFNTEGTTLITVNTKDMMGCIERASLISRDTNRSPVKLTVESEKERIIIESNTETGTFYDELPAEIDGLDLRISFNPRFMSDVLKVVNDEKIHMTLTTPLSPCIIKSVDAGEKDGKFKYLMMPLRDIR